MRLSEDRINFIATQIADGLIKNRRVRYRGNRNMFIAEIGKVILEDIKIEDKIDKEVIQRIRRMERDIPEGSAEWQAVYQREKEALAIRYGYEL